jgi:hypothetical protein
MKLTPAERLLLINQYRILAELRPSEAASHAVAIEVLERGYEGLYPRVFGDLSDPPMSPGECRPVIETLEMFRVLQASCSQLGRDVEIDPRAVTFAGFDAAEEPRQHHLASLLMRTEERFRALGRQRLDGIVPAGLETYRRMLSRFRWYWDPREPDALLTRDQVADVLAAASSEDSRPALEARAR